MVIDDDDENGMKIVIKCEMWWDYDDRDWIMMFKHNVNYNQDEYDNVMKVNRMLILRMAMQIVNITTDDNEEDDD